MRLFEILDKLNQADAEDGNSRVDVCNEVISIDKNGVNGYVKIGIPGNIAQDLIINDMKDKSIILLIIDLDEYNKIKNDTL